MNWLGKLFTKKKKTYKADSNFKLLIINDDEQEVYKILGISEERADALAKIVVKAYDENTHLHSLLADVVEECKHINEVVFSTVISMKLIDQKQSRNPIAEFLKELGRNNG